MRMQHGRCFAGKRPIKNFTEDGSRGFPKMFASKYCIASMMSSGGKASGPSWSLATESHPIQHWLNGKTWTAWMVLRARNMKALHSLGTTAPFPRTGELQYRQYSTCFNEEANPAGALRSMPPSCWPKHKIRQVRIREKVQSGKGFLQYIYIYIISSCLPHHISLISGSWRSLFACSLLNNRVVRAVLDLALIGSFASPVLFMTNEACVQGRARCTSAGWQPRPRLHIGQSRSHFAETKIWRGLSLSDSETDQELSSCRTSQGWEESSGPNAPEARLWSLLGQL